LISGWSYHADRCLGSRRMIAHLHTSFSPSVGSCCNLNDHTVFIKAGESQRKRA
jgi:hypothetical protein